MLGKFGETLVVDWGLAKAMGKSEPTDDDPSLGALAPPSASGSGFDATAPGSAIGTPAYMSPDQVEGRLEELGPATDVYSLGATLYTVLTGKPPFTGKGGGSRFWKKSASGNIRPCGSFSRRRRKRSKRSAPRRWRSNPPTGTRPLWNWRTNWKNGWPMSRSRHGGNR